MSDIPVLGAGMFEVGDKVQQIGPIGLVPLVVNPYVVSEAEDGVELSTTPGGPPLTDVHGNPRHYPRDRFRKVA